MKTFYIETFGCQMNKNDSELMALSLYEHGFEEAEDILKADIVIFNTCSVREHAENRVISWIMGIKNKVHDNNGIVVLAGCMAQRTGRDLIHNNIVDLIVGPYQSPVIGKMIMHFMANNSSNSYISQDINDFSDRINFNLPLQKMNSENSWHQWVTITHGCENFCTYCIVPYVRGKLISFPSAEIIKYVKTLASKGIKEITLLGQNVNQYGNDNNDMPFYQLLENIAIIEGIEKINFLTSHPMDFSDDIIKVMADHDNISKSIHLPLQSGSDTILHFMNRKYTMHHYYTIIEKINSFLKSYSITTDLIVGFPGETIDDYHNTLDAVKKIEYDDAFMYAYSPREGTPAFKLEETLSRDEKIERLNKLIKIQRTISHEKLKKRINQIENTIVERISKKSTNDVMGKTFLNHPVVIPGSKDDIGKKIQIRIESVHGFTLQGRRIA